MGAMTDLSTATAAAADLRAEVIALAQTLLRIDSTNGNETQVAHALAAYLAQNGVTAELVGPDPARLNLIAWLRGSGRAAGAGAGSTPPRSLAFVGHSDVVPADAADWTHPPFAAFLDADGYLWGRGALDMKGEVAARAVAFASLAREGFRPRGDLLLLVAADEEDGAATVGMNWLTSNRPDLAVDYALNEGGGLPYRLSDGRLMAAIGVGEKGTCPVRVDVLGEAGHASMPGVGDNPVPRLGAVLTAIGLGQPEPSDHHTLRATLDALLGAGTTEAIGVPAALARATALHPTFPFVLPALSGTTMAPTLLHGSPASNVIPARVGVGLDARLLPGSSDAEVLAAVRARLGDLAALCELSFPVPSVAGNESPPTGPLWDACRAFLAEEVGAEPLPMLSTGFTDSVYLRRDFGTVAYGFSPIATTPAQVVESGCHNADERIHVDDLALSVAFHREVATSLLG